MSEASEQHLGPLIYLDAHHTHIYIDTGNSL